MGTPQYGPAPAQAAAPPPPFRLVPPAGSRLEQLRAELETARAAVREAESREKAIAKGMLAEAVPLAPPGTTSVIVAGGPGIPDWNCHWIPPGTRLDAKRIRAERADIFSYYAKPVAGYWKIDKADR